LLINRRESDSLCGMAGKTRQVLIADDHEMIRDGLRSNITELVGDCDIITACNGAEASALLENESGYSLIILDLFMPETDGFALVRDTCDRFPDTPVVVMSASEDAGHMRKVIDTGASGYIPKSCGRKLMLSALELILNGGTYIPPGLLKADTTNYATLTSDSRAIDNQLHKPAGLTERQLEVLHLLARGLPNKLIARELDVSEHTVKTHIRTLFAALNVNNRTQAVLVAQQKNYLSASMSKETDNKRTPE